MYFSNPASGCQDLRDAEERSNLEAPQAVPQAFPLKLPELLRENGANSMEELE